MTTSPSTLTPLVDARFEPTAVPTEAESDVLRWLAIMPFLA